MQPGNQMLPQLRVEAQGWFTDQPVGKVAKELWDKGYAFDYVSDAQLKAAKVADGKIQMPGGNYKLIVVPGCKYMPLNTVKQLLQLASQGATLVFYEWSPNDVTGLNDLNAQRKTLDACFGDKFFNNLQKKADYGKGVVFDVVGSGRVYRRDGLFALLTADVPHERIASQFGLSFVRRSFDGGWDYFIANRTETNFDGWVSLARPAKFAVILDPMTGNSGIAARNGNDQIHLQLAAGQSVILRAFDHELKLLGEFPVWTYWQTNGQPVEIGGDWKVKFLEGGPVLPADFSTTKLASWTTFPDTNCQAFAGAAKYETTFDAPKSDAKNYFLNLGNVCQSARVKLNGKDYGTLIMPPFRVVVDNLKPTGNILEVEVTSVAANRIRDLDRRGVKWKTFRDINMVDINYKPFDASNWPLVDCGLLGPVTLTPVKAE
jgi:hypothetical protein